MQPGQFNPKGEDWIGRKFAELEREIRELKAANPFGAMGVEPKPDGLIVQGYETVNGPLEVNGTSEFNGSMSINGPLILQPGSIENDALTSPIYPTTAHADLNGFSLEPGPNVEKLRATVPVPAGYTKALVMATATMSRTNPTAAVDSFYLDCRINGVISGWSSQPSVPAGRDGSAINVGTALLTGLSESFFIGAYASTALAPWPEGAGAAAVLDVDAIVLFLR